MLLPFLALELKDAEFLYPLLHIFSETGVKLKHLWRGGIPTNASCSQLQLWFPSCDSPTGHGSIGRSSDFRQRCTDSGDGLEGSDGYVEASGLGSTRWQHGAIELQDMMESEFREVGVDDERLVLIDVYILTYLSQVWFMCVVDCWMFFVFVAVWSANKRRCIFRVTSFDMEFTWLRICKGGETLILPNSRHQRKSGGRDHGKTSMIHYKHQSGQLKILIESIFTI